MRIVCESFFKTAKTIRPFAVVGNSKIILSKLTHGGAANKKYSIELGIYSLIDKPGIADSAYSYAQKAKLFFEWEGFSDGPLTEADFTETYIENHPNSIINPYLLLFLLHRYRAAFECRK